MGTIKTICAWCGRYLAGRDDAETVSHGMCPACVVRTLLEAGLTRDDAWAVWIDVGGEG